MTYGSGQTGNFGKLEIYRHRPRQTWDPFVYVEAERLKNEEHDDFLVAKYRNSIQISL